VEDGREAASRASALARVPREQRSIGTRWRARHVHVSTSLKVDAAGPSGQPDGQELSACRLISLLLFFARGEARIAAAALTKPVRAFTPRSAGTSVRTSD
jgi:hypothetical protein